MNNINFFAIIIRTKFYSFLNKFLPKVVKIFRGNVKQIRAYKDGTGWFVEDLNGYSKSANELVLGVPELIEFLVGKDSRMVSIEMDDKQFGKSIKLDLIFTDKSGTTYQYIDTSGVQHMLWLCPVFFWYFKEVPKTFYVYIRAI